MHRDEHHQEPVLQRQPEPQQAFLPRALIAIGALAAIATVGHIAQKHPLTATLPGQSREAPSVLRMAPGQVAGAFILMDQQLAAASPRLLATLNMPELERQQVQAALKEGRVRIAALTIWDTHDEDGDVVALSAAGFVQEVLITKFEKTFYMPVVPGGTVRIVGVKDGGGGGITLGVRTLLGPFPLPPIAPGQILEIPAL